MKEPVKACVVGAGLMGHGIAQTFAQAGHQVALFDIDEKRRELALSRIEQNLQQLGEEPSGVLANISLCSELSQAAADVDIVIEAVSEVLGLKQEVFEALSHLAPSDAILSSNTSVIPITAIGEKLDDAARSRLVGTHWWNPPHLIPLVEIIRTEYTAEEVFNATFDLMASLGKKPVKVLMDVPGFIGNRLQHAMWREALHLVTTGVCDAETIDVVVKNSFGLRLPYLGPMENADLVGLTLTQQVHKFIFPHLCNDASASSLVDELLDAGHQGMESGRGLKTWSHQQAVSLRHQLSHRLIDTLGANDNNK
ncbi:3-hydroxyacyl-CoA dehydrogenase family protein [Billgrantia ethanolica]|uniref:3-hydroxyacyl-CoA dehydrogenase family protein n=1 Tax=Billgrantia ethanolica TaxID=2733486 RepID=A0ABS8ZYC7_9GAMM|nr:3-hydroxyacyl-CoA dehydrogenase family protein [Halomonas ethanolica]MCE8001634.1 3-hydroxyacyl-CoA dehydrogenase family protein [Halomonas ethanolica]